MKVDTTHNDIDELRPVLEAKLRDELNLLAKKLGVSGFSRLKKSQLVDLLLTSNRNSLKTMLFPTWWSKYHNHVYGNASIIGVLLAIAFFIWPMSETPTETNTFTPNVSVEGVGEPFKINKDTQRRNRILGITFDWEKVSSGTMSLERIDVKTLELLFRERFIDPNEKQNESPTAIQFLSFMQKYPVVLAQGYVVSPNREDYRITIDGLSVQPSYASGELKLAFFEFCKDADELNIEDGLRAWWD